ncbi:hypothetical protein P8452_66618 [Trifolium repens]|nr:hypothetical protein P8452_66618 [Trifolium repens]
MDSSFSLYKNKGFPYKKYNIKLDATFDNDPLAWSRPLVRHHCGEFSMAAVKANMDMEDQSQVEVGTDALFVGVYDGHKGDTTAIYLRDHIFGEILRRIQQNIKHMDNRVVNYSDSETVLRAYSANYQRSEIFLCVRDSEYSEARLCKGLAAKYIKRFWHALLKSKSFGEDWIKLLLSIICLEESQLPVLFSKLPFRDIFDCEDTKSRDDQFSSEQVFLLQILSEILNERIEDVTISKDVALFIYGIFKKSIGVLEQAVRVKSGLPSGITAVDVLGYSLTMLRDICAHDSMRGDEEDANNVVDVLLSYGLVELFLILLGDLEPPSIIRKGIKQSDNQDGANCSSKPCPYKGFRRDIVALIGNCVHRRKHVQDEIRSRNGILLLLQQCVTDDDNPYLREWGIWCVRNVLEGNEENQKVVSELELKGSADVPQISALGLKLGVQSLSMSHEIIA